MEKIIKIGDINIPVRSTAASVYIYKSNFKRDLIKDLMKLGKGMPKNADKITDEEMFELLIESDFDFDVFYRSLWVFARAKNPDILPFEQWLDSFDMQPLDFFTEVFPQVQDMLLGNVQTSVRSKNG